MTPTLDIFTVDKMAIIMESRWGEDLGRELHHARLWLDDKPTSVRCMHNHTKAENAIKCLYELKAEFTERLPKTISVVEVFEGCFEVTDGPDTGWRFVWHTGDDE